MEKIGEKRRQEEIHQPNNGEKSKTLKIRRIEKQVELKRNSLKD